MQSCLSSNFHFYSVIWIINCQETILSFWNQRKSIYRNGTFQLMNPWNDRCLFHLVKWYWTLNRSLRLRLCYSVLQCKVRKLFFFFFCHDSWSSFSQFKNAIMLLCQKTGWHNFDSSWLKVSSTNTSRKSLLWWDSCTSSQFTEVSHFQLESMTTEWISNGSLHSCWLLSPCYFCLLALREVDVEDSLLGSLVKYLFSSAALWTLDPVWRLRKGMSLCHSPQSCGRYGGGLQVVCVMVKVNDPWLRSWGI